MTTEEERPETATEAPASEFKATGRVLDGFELDYAGVMQMGGFFDAIVRKLNAQDDLIGDLQNRLMESNARNAERDERVAALEDQLTHVAREASSLSTRQTEVAHVSQSAVEAMSDLGDALGRIRELNEEVINGKVRMDEFGRDVSELREQTFGLLVLQQRVGDMVEEASETKASVADLQRKGSEMDSSVTKIGASVEDIVDKMAQLDRIGLFDEKSTPGEADGAAAAAETPPRASTPAVAESPAPVARVPSSTAGDPVFNPFVQRKLEADIAEEMPKRILFLEGRLENLRNELEVLRSQCVVPGGGGDTGGADFSADLGAPGDDDEADAAAAKPRETEEERQRRKDGIVTYPLEAALQQLSQRLGPLERANAALEARLQGRPAPAPVVAAPPRAPSEDEAQRRVRIADAEAIQKSVRSSKADAERRRQEELRMARERLEAAQAAKTMDAEAMQRVNTSIKRIERLLHRKAEKVDLIRLHDFIMPRQRTDGGAAGSRHQPDRCLSCDRPQNIMTTAFHPPSIPSNGLPATFPTKPAGRGGGGPLPAELFPSIDSYRTSRDVGGAGTTLAGPISPRRPQTAAGHVERAPQSSSRYVRPKSSAGAPRPPASASKDAPTLDDEPEAAGGDGDATEPAGERAVAAEPDVVASGAVSPPAGQFDDA